MYKESSELGSVRCNARPPQEAEIHALRQHNDKLLRENAELVGRVGARGSELREQKHANGDLMYRLNAVREEATASHARIKELLRVQPLQLVDDCQPEPAIYVARVNRRGSELENEYDLFIGKPKPLAFNHDELWTGLHLGPGTRVRGAVEKLRDVPGITPVGMDDISPDHVPMGMALMTQEIFGRYSGSSGPAVRSLFDAVTQWARVLRSVPGQKNILLYTRGFGRSLVRPGDPNHFAFQTMARELASANTRVFSVNTTTGVADKIALGVFHEDSLDHLARTTGRAYYHDVNFSTKIASDIQDATASYYTSFKSGRR